MANSGDPSTFSFVIDAFPAYTKFNKTKKVLATLQILDPTDAKHNYSNTDVIGHNGRTGDNDTYIQGLYGKSVFDPVSTQPSNTTGGNGNTTGGNGGTTGGEGNNG